MLQEIKRLHALGFAVHLLRSKSKAPLENAWTTGPKKTLKELSATYRPGMNIGVRLGEASQLFWDTGFHTDNSYLAVLDCDVKSTKEKHTKEMLEWLEAAFPLIDLQDAPCVSSGRGNGSQHIYVRTREPVNPRTLFKSNERVKVYMPSVKASAKDREDLDALEISKGFRMRAAWEISLMGEGQQVVLPPSIHPDSLKPYKWVRLLKKLSDLPLLDVRNLPESEKKEFESLEDFEAVDVDLDSKKLKDSVKQMIREGAGGDRSAELMSVCMSMCNAGMKDNEILSVLTDKENYLGSIGYEHRKTNSRKAAADWVFKYTLSKARDKTDLSNYFDDNVEVKKLTPREEAEQTTRIKGSHNWRWDLERSRDGGAPKNSVKNIVLILKNASKKPIFRHNEFSSNDEYGDRAPWGGVRGVEVRDIDFLKIKEYIYSHFRFEPAVTMVDEAIKIIATKNTYHPVREYLEALPVWDGKPRAETWLKRLLNAKAPEEYLKAISKKILVAMIARVYEPGCKFDTVPVLVGVQGALKSTSIRALADPWFSDAHMNIGDKDGVLAMRSVWVLELGEMSSLSRAEVNQVKEFISRATDKIREPYGRKMQSYPRQCIFIGSTNNDEFLKDDTGNRRFWPVSVGKCNVAGIKAEREQLFAEALSLYTIGEPLWLENPDAIEGAESEQNMRMEYDSLLDKARDFFEKEHDNFDSRRFTLAQAFDSFGPFASLKDDRVSQVRAGKTLRMLGFEKRQSRDSKGAVRKFWVNVKNDLKNRDTKEV